MFIDAEKGGNWISEFARRLLGEGGRSLLEERIIYYDRLPKWLRDFLEFYFPDFFPPESVPIATTTTTSTSTTTTTTTTTTTSTTRTTTTAIKTSTTSEISVPSELKQFHRDLLIEHNQLRSLGGLRPLKWHADLAVNAEKYIKSQDNLNNCKFEHSRASTRKQVGPFTQAGENLYMSWGFLPTGKRVAESWYDEINCYRYGKIGESCTKFSGPKCDMGYIMVGHFTQMMWDTATHVGCGVHQCGSCEKLCPQIFVSCLYGSTSAGFGGNMWGMYPFGPDTAHRLQIPSCIPRNMRGDVEETERFEQSGVFLDQGEGFVPQYEWDFWQMKLVQGSLS